MNYLDRCDDDELREIADEIDGCEMYQMSPLLWWSGQDILDWIHEAINYRPEVGHRPGDNK